MLYGCRCDTDNNTETYDRNVMPTVFRSGFLFDMTDIYDNETAEFSHVPVMLGECIDGLNIREDGTYADCTAGGGGHSEEIIKRLKSPGRLIAVDQDTAAIEAVRARLAPYSDRLTLVHSNFSEAEKIFEGTPLDGVLIDLGVSSYQLDTPERGFSYMHDAPLDMRMDRSRALSAYDVVNGYGEKELADVIYKWGEERFSRQIAVNIVASRPVNTTLELVDIVKRSMPKAARDGGHHPAKRTFQAIRIEVNNELDIIEPTIKSLVKCLRPGGRLAVITFHSLEDREVKQAMQELATGCTCPKSLPVCVCGRKPQVKLVTRKPILPSDGELEANPRARSAKLRICEKL